MRLSGQAFRDLARWTLSRYGFCSNDRMTGFLDRLSPGRVFLSTHDAMRALDCP